MGNYATTAQFKARTDTFATPTQIAELARTSDAAAIILYLESLITRAEGMVNAYIMGSYTIPVTALADNGFLQEATLAIAEYELFKRGMGDDVPTKYKATRDETMKILTDIANGVAMVPGASSKLINTSLELQSDTPRMDEESLKGFVGGLEDEDDSI
jgi:phage gp36-like protein